MDPSVKKPRKPRVNKPKYPPEFSGLLEVQKNLYLHFKEGMTKIVENLSDKVERHERTIKKTKEILERTEDTVCNILAAIRQNQCLQAWYPPQNGYPEMYVSGNHPLSDVNQRYSPKTDNFCKSEQDPFETIFGSCDIE